MRIAFHGTVAGAGDIAVILAAEIGIATLDRPGFIEIVTGENLGACLVAAVIIGAGGARNIEVITVAGDASAHIGAFGVCGAHAGQCGNGSDHCKQDFLLHHVLSLNWLTCLDSQFSEVR